MLTGAEPNLKTHLDAYRHRDKFKGTSRCLLLYLHQMGCGKASESIPRRRWPGGRLLDVARARCEVVVRLRAVQGRSDEFRSFEASAS